MDLSAKVKELERVIAALNKRHDLLMIVISENLAGGKELTLEDAITAVRTAAWRLEHLESQAQG